MKKTDFTKEKDEDLRKTLAQAREEVRAFRFSAAGSAARNVKALRVNKKNIARMLTELNTRKREEARGASARPREGFLEQSEQKSPRGVQHRYGTA